MADKRQQLVDVATGSIQDSGLNSLSFRTLGDKVGVKSSSVHYYFPEKAELAGVVIEEYSADLQRRLVEIEQRQIAPAKKIESFIKIFDDVLKAEKFCLCGMMAAELSSLDDQRRALLLDYFQDTEAWLEKILNAHSTDNASNWKPAVIAKVIMSGLEGAILIDRVEGSTNRLKAQRELIKSLLG